MSRSTPGNYKLGYRVDGVSLVHHSPERKGQFKMCSEDMVQSRRSMGFILI